MTPQATDFDLPEDIMYQLNDPDAGVTSEINYSDDPEGYEVIVKDAADNVIYNCARPCPRLS